MSVPSKACRIWSASSRAALRGNVDSQLELGVSLRNFQGLGVGVSGDEINSHQTGVDHIVDSVAATTTYANYFDRGSVVTFNKLEHHDPPPALGYFIHIPSDSSRALLLSPAGEEDKPHGKNKKTAHTYKEHGQNEVKVRRSHCIPPGQNSGIPQSKIQEFLNSSIPQFLTLCH
jgi:hypothetical protein